MQISKWTVAGVAVIAGFVLHAYVPAAGDLTLYVP